MPCTFLDIPSRFLKFLFVSPCFLLFFRPSRETAGKMKTDEKLNAAKTDEWEVNATSLENNRLFFDGSFF